MKTFITSMILTAILFFLGENNVPHMNDIANQELQQYTFEPLALALYIVTGLICLSPTRYRNRFTNFIANNSSKLHIAYQASAGSILGWGIGTGAAFVLNTGLIVLPLVIVVCCLFLLLALGPLWVYESAGGLALQHKEFMLSERRHVKILRLLGAFLVAIGSLGLYIWWKNG